MNDASARLLSLVQHARRGVLLAALCGVSLHLDATAADPLAPKALWFAVAAALIPALSLLKLWWGQPLRLPSKPILAWALCWCGLAILSGLLSPQPKLSQASWQAWCLAALLLIGALDFLSEAEGQAWLLKVLCVAALAAGAWSLAQGLGLDPSAWGRSQAFGDRVAGSFGNPNFAGGYFVLCLPLLVWLGLSADQALWRWLGRAAALLALAGIALSASKAAWLGLAASAAVAGHLFFWSQAEAGPKRRALGWLGLGLGLALAAGLGLSPASRQRLLGGPAAWQESLRFRQSVWQGSVRAWSQRPLLGHGPGTFSAVYPRFRDPESLKGAQEHAYEVAAPENWLLHLAVETGAMGLAAALALLLALTWPLRRLSAAWASGRRASLSLALLSGLLGSLACNLAGLDLFLPSTLLPFILLLALGLSFQDGQAAFSLNADAWPRLFVSAGLALGASVPLASAQLQWQSSRLLAEGKALASAGRFAEAAPKLALAADFQPTNLEARYFHACALQDQATPESLRAAEEAFDGLRSMAPDYVQVHARLGRLYASQGRLAEAEAQWQRHLELDPYDRAIVQEAASSLAQAGRLEQAEQVLTQAQPRFPQDKEIPLNLSKLKVARAKAAKGKP